MVMPRKKVIKNDKDSNNKKFGLPSSNRLEDTHPRLLPNFFRTQVMVYYDTTPEPSRNEIEFMLGNCQRSIDDGDNTWAFMLLSWRLTN